MRTRPADLDDDVLRVSLARSWAIEATRLDYVPEGGGSHHWRAQDTSGRPHFVTVDDLDDKDWLAQGRDDVFAALDRALNTAAALPRDAGLDFVVAPIPGREDRLVVRLDGRYALSVFPYLEGESYPFGPHTDPQRRAEMLKMVVSLHGATGRLAYRAPSHHLTFGGRRDLAGFLDDPDRPWDAGPFSASAQALFRPRAAALSRIVDGFDRLVEATAGVREQTVISHGEPHAANTMFVGGRLMLIDWDTVALAPPERDLWMIDQPDELASYEEATGRRVDPGVMTLYRLRWYLDDIASAVRLFRNPHLRTTDTQRWSDGLRAQLDQLSSWAQALG